MFNILNMLNMSLLARKMIYNMATSSATKYSPFVANQNLRFQNENCDLILYFFTPELKQIKSNDYKINPTSNTLSLAFAPKTYSNTKSASKKSKNVTFSFNYEQLSDLLNIEQRKGETLTLKKGKQQSKKYQQLAIKYNQIHDTLNLKLKKIQTKKAQNEFSFQVTDEQDNKQLEQNIVEFNLQYSEYKIIQLLIKNSLFELSGLGTIFQMKKIEDIGKINKSTMKNIDSFEKQINQFYK